MRSPGIGPVRGTVRRSARGSVSGSLRGLLRSAVIGSVSRRPSIVDRFHILMPMPKGPRPA